MRMGVAYTHAEQGVVTTASAYKHLRPGSQYGHKVTGSFFAKSQVTSDKDGPGAVTGHGSRRSCRCGWSRGERSFCASHVTRFSKGPLFCILHDSVRRRDK